MLMPRWLAIIAGLFVVVNAGGSIPPQVTFGDNQQTSSSSIIPASWAMTYNELSSSSNLCYTIISPAFGGVYQSGSTLAIRWMLGNRAINSGLNSSFEFTITLIDNFFNTTTEIASGLDPYSSVYLWDVPSNASFSRRSYIIVSQTQNGTAETIQGNCDDSPQVVGPFTILSNQQPYFFSTGPDPGIGYNDTDLGNVNGSGIGLLNIVPMGRLFTDVAIPIAWYCTINTIDVIDIYLMADQGDFNTSIALNLNVNSARYYYSVPSSSILPTNTTYSILMYGSQSNSSQVISWARDGPYNITTAS